ncbi:unnamed protein product [Camellia sinensis]
MPLGANPKRVATWEPIIEKVKKRLSSWKRRYLSLGGRITLVKSVLSLLPLYYMSLFRIPSTVANTIDKFQRSFFWGDSEEKKKLYLVSWEACSLSRKFGGLVHKLFIDNLQFILGNSKRIKFWFDGWLFNSPLSSLYPRLFILATDKDYFVRQ